MDLEGNVIISEYPDFCDSINEKLVNKLDEYIQTIYTDNRIVFEILVNNLKMEVIYLCMSTYRRLKKLNC